MSSNDYIATWLAAWDSAAAVVPAYLVPVLIMAAGARVFRAVIMAAADRRSSN